MNILVNHNNKLPKQKYKKINNNNKNKRNNNNKLTI